MLYIVIGIYIPWIICGLYSAGRIFLFDQFDLNWSVERKRLRERSQKIERGQARSRERDQKKVVKRKVKRKKSRKS